MKILFAPDSFKGSLKSSQIIERLVIKARQQFKDCEILRVPIADGGEGTVEAIVSAANGEIRTLNVMGPLMGEVVAKYGVIGGDTVIIEMAEASGITLVDTEKRNPLNSTSYGTGQLIRHVLNEGYRKIIIGIGGSATNDGGIGAMQALGVKFLDSAGKEVGMTGRYLEEIADIDISGLDACISEAEITVMCDVDNPLTGEEGATFVYGPQKGAESDGLLRLENGMKNYARVIKEKLDVDISSVGGAGAAGGLGAALMVFLGARLKPGIETLLDLISFDELLKDVDLVVTGEGKLDSQSVHGKVPIGVARRCKKHSIPVIAIVGGMDKGTDPIYDYGIESVISTVNGIMSLEQALENAVELLDDAAERMFRFLKVGMVIGGKSIKKL